VRRLAFSSLAICLLATACGSSKGDAPNPYEHQNTPERARPPLAVSAPLHLCPEGDRASRVLSKSATLVLVPSHPTSALICRYWGGAEPGHRAKTLAEALQVRRQGVASHMASELNALRPAAGNMQCPAIPVRGGRTVLFVFGYRGTGDATVLFGGGCGIATNGRVFRDGLGDSGEHWPDEGIV